MKVFVTGASGHVGRAVSAELQAAGHAVVGLARDEDGAVALEAAGVEVRRGDLDDHDVLREAAADSDGVIHLAFKHEMMAAAMAEAAAADLRAVKAMGDALRGSHKPMVVTSPLMLLASSDLVSPPYTEDDTVPSGPRIDTENAAIALAEAGVRSAVVRLPPIVHSEHDGAFGFVPELVRAARRAGASGVVGDGSYRWPTSHVTDVARVYRLAVEQAPAGTRLHAVAEEGVAFREIADAIATGLGLPVDQVAPEDALTRFTFPGRFMGVDAPTSSERTRRVLGWAPTAIDLVADLRAGHYFND